LVTKFLKSYIELVVEYPDDVTISIDEINETFSQINIKARACDIGKLIGKNGNMINALKTMVNGCKAKNNISYKIQVDALGE
jgi:predicted RNA-binding protein YlqC (UPF0109 family)